jgi:hypothetical protein
LRRRYWRIERMVWAMETNDLLAELMSLWVLEEDGTLNVALESRCGGSCFRSTFGKPFPGGGVTRRLWRRARRWSGAADTPVGPEQDRVTALALEELLGAVAGSFAHLRWAKRQAA